ncbi:uncharacterized protein BXZ73DRAFT_98977 [Epithele typhae]|uniref:uncharacterized protein n=1 Tax=Epithele typhae TaxID=378194 RepID=UPI0020082201|nr:uncharacterized protein BXZ73DRAFT_98977 [Epithele typhae]KAH9940546.1 hypothetical protein BXZ73DRAFT_98977 [Epithele typhae]
MVGLARSRTFRDVALVLFGATAMHFATSFIGPLSSEHSIIVSTQVSEVSHDHAYGQPANHVHAHDDTRNLGTDKAALQDLLAGLGKTQKGQKTFSDEVDLSYTIPETTMLSHAPGWTVFKNLYMSNGTIYIVTTRPNSFPDISLMTSTGLPAENTPENIQARLPTREDMSFVTPEEARDMWAGDVESHEQNRLWSVPGNTFIVNEPSQFLDHYYHFCAEWLFGAWAFWQGAFSATVEPGTAHKSSAPPVDRVIFANAGARGWRDRPGFNSYFFRAAFPSTTVEVEEDWDDRTVATSNPAAPRRAWHFPYALFSDRSASFKGARCGSQNQRIASEAIDYMRDQKRLTTLWWEPVRRGVLRFAGIDPRVVDTGVRALAVVEGAERVRGAAALEGHKAFSGLSDKEVVISYISRQSARRHLIEADHAALVTALEEMTAKHGWELNVVEAEKLSKEQQLEIAAKSTILLGVHGNGLTHLIMMPVTPVSTVIEIFYPGGFAHDYHWTSTALGMRHFAVWNDTFLTYPNEPSVNYPEGFQGTQIPVYAPTIVQIIEERIAGKHPISLV